MSEIAEFPLPSDVTDEERATAKREIGKYAKIVGETDKVIRFDGELIGQTGPVWHLQYTRMYKLPKGYLAAGHDLPRRSGTVQHSAVGDGGTVGSGTRRQDRAYY